jgi:polysaccharide deacetylase 2 family uncharacterized protein YibQ
VIKVVSRTRTTNKKQRTGNKKAYQRKGSRVRLIVLVLVFAGVFGYALYRLSTTRYTHQPLQPLFETYPSEGIEAEIKDIDRRIYDALLDLNIPATDVTFKTVEPRKNIGGLWSFSELEIRVPPTVQQSDIKKAFLRRVSKGTPKKSLRFASGTKQGLILDLSVDGHHTHRLFFVKRMEKRPLESLPSTLPKVAIIIDDLGYDEKVASKFLMLDGVMSFSVLPHSPFQKEIATTIHHSGKDVLVHLPMEPIEYPEVDPGVGALLCSMTPDELLDQLQKDLDTVPFAVGVNNHMGSKLTQDPARMRQIFTILKKRNLFFVDSLTSPRSCCQHSASLLKLRFLQRHVFLDHVQDQNAIRFQIKRLIGMARKHGKAIGIGHPYPITWEVLSKELPDIKNKVELVRVSQLVG